MTWLLLLLAFWPLLLLALIPKMGIGWGCLYTGVQLVMWWAQVVGIVLLIDPCRRQLWVLGEWSTNRVRTPRRVSEWEHRYRWLNPIWGNPEDGVSGAEAVLGNGKPYMPNANPAWRAYCWSAWRNSCNALKYEFASDHGPLVTFWFFGKRQAGWLPMPQIEHQPHVPVLG